MPDLVRRLLPGARIGLVAVATAALAACSGSSTTSLAPSVAPASPIASSAQPSQASTAPSAAASMPEPSASQSEAPSQSAAAASPSAEPTGVPTAIDPCQLIPADEAGKLAGTTFGAGKASNLSGNGNMCVYGSQSKNVFEVIVAVAPDVATAKAEELAAEAELKTQAAQASQGLTITPLLGFTSGSDAVLIELKPNSIGLDGRAIYVLRGTVFFGFSDLVLGGSAPSADAMKSEAMTALGRLP